MDKNIMLDFDLVSDDYVKSMFFYVPFGDKIRLDFTVRSTKQMDSIIYKNLEQLEIAEDCKL